MFLSNSFDMMKNLPGGFAWQPQDISFWCGDKIGGFGQKNWRGNDEEVGFPENMAIPVVEFSREGYNIRKNFE